MDGEPVDLFQDLDRDLMEIFQRNHYAEFFRQIPPEHHNQRLDQLNELIRRRSHAGTYNPYVKLIWLMNVIPLPVVKYRRLWRDFNFSQLAIRLVGALVLTVTRLFRFTMFLIGSSFYLQRIAQTLFMFGNELTYSNNFFKDVFTYSLRHNRSAFERWEIIESRGILYSLGLADNFEIISIFQYVKQFIYHSMLLQINHKCMVVEEDGLTKTICGPDDTSLIFKFHNIFRPRFSGLNDQWFTVVVVAIYLTYALIGNLIGMNIFYLYTLNIVNRFSKFAGYFGKLAGVIWNASRELC